MTGLQAADLIAFENRIAEYFNEGRIRAPIHLYSGMENEIIEVFKQVKPEDWVFCSWRSHYQCLLKGVPKDEIEKAILEGRSIALCFLEYQVMSSAIVGGQIPQAVGVALNLRRSNSKGHVWCFVGDMTSETGIFQTCARYSLKHNLPITFVIEDNGKSVLTDTREVWNSHTLRYQENPSTNIISYRYTNKYPHAGAGKRVQF